MHNVPWMRKMVISSWLARVDSALLGRSIGLMCDSRRVKAPSFELEPHTTSN